MVSVIEDGGNTLLSNVTDADGDAVRPYRLDGVVVTSWPWVKTTTYGDYYLDDEGIPVFERNATALPSTTPGTLITAGTFTFTAIDEHGAESNQVTQDIVIKVPDPATTKPATASEATISNVTAAGYDITYPPDPSDGGSALTKRVTSHHRPADLLLSPPPNGHYLPTETWTPGETITISRASLGAAATYDQLTVRVRYDNAVDNGDYNTGVVIDFPAEAQPPVIDDQPSFNAAAYTAGDIASLDMGGATAANGTNPIAVSFAYFTAASVSKIGEVPASGDVRQWNTAGEATANLRFAVTYTDTVTGAKITSNEATAVLTGAGSLSLKQQITLLRDDPTTRGRQSTNQIKVPGVDPLPAGVVLGSNVSGHATLTFTSSITLIEDWDFTDYIVIVQSGVTIGTITQCKFGETTGVQGNRRNVILDVYAGGVITNLEWTDFIGPFSYHGAPKYIGNSGSISGTGANITVPEIKNIRRCFFDGINEDPIKAMGSESPGGQTIEYCYFGPGTYTNGTPVGADPHTDQIAVVAAKNGLTIRQIYFECRGDVANGPARSLLSGGQNNVVQAMRNNTALGRDRLIDFIDISEVIGDRDRSLQSYNMQIQSRGQPNFGPVSIRDSWFGHRNNNPNSTHVYPNPTNLVEWSNVRDLDTDNLIPHP